MPCRKDIVGIGVILTEAKDWADVLGEDAKLIHSLAHIPQFTKAADQTDSKWEPISETFLRPDEV
jgi:hypothetical protein